jgi:hypothetical protein
MACSEHKQAEVARAEGRTPDVTSYRRSKQATVFGRAVADYRGRRRKQPATLRLQGSVEVGDTSLSDYSLRDAILQLLDYRNRNPTAIACDYHT